VEHRVPRETDDDPASPGSDAHAEQPEIMAALSQQAVGVRELRRPRRLLFALHLATLRRAGQTRTPA
jgi:hypothetical protein